MLSNYVSRRTVPKNKKEKKPELSAEAVQRKIDDALTRLDKLIKPPHEEYIVREGLPSLLYKFSPYSGKGELSYYKRPSDYTKPQFQMHRSDKGIIPDPGQLLPPITRKNTTSTERQMVAEELEPKIAVPPGLEALMKEGVRAHNRKRSTQDLFNEHMQDMFWMYGDEGISQLLMDYDWYKEHVDKDMTEREFLERQLVPFEFKSTFTKT